jgi:hypothetical protein
MTHNKQEMNIRAFSGIQTHETSNQAASDLHRELRGHQNQL